MSTDKPARLAELPATCHQLPRPAVLGDPWPVRGVPLVLGRGGAGSGAGAAPVLSLRDLLSEPGQVCPPETPPRPRPAPSPCPGRILPGMPPHRRRSPKRWVLPWQDGFYPGSPVGSDPSVMHSPLGQAASHQAGGNKPRVRGCRVMAP